MGESRSALDPGSRVAPPSDAEQFAGDVTDWLLAQLPGVRVTPGFRRERVAKLLPAAEQILAGGRELGLSREQMLAETLAAHALAAAAMAVTGESPVTWGR
jgi:hypothetical protein